MSRLRLYEKLVELKTPLLIDFMVGRAEIEPAIT